jgi:DNA-binding CsgD family transcriptional regulator
MRGSKISLSRPLTSREEGVLRGIVSGKTYASIGSDLGIAYDTVKTITNRIRAKTGCRNKASLIVWAVESGVKP